MARNPNNEGLGEPARILIAAIDDYAEHLTGDRAALHSKPHSIP